MDDKKAFLAIGMMSGTSLDGVDAALIKTDGTHIIELGNNIFIDYPEYLRKKIRKLFTDLSDILYVEKEFTLFYSEVVNQLLKQSGLSSIDIDVIGFHGQTIFHRPADGLTYQIGNGQLLAEKTKINVVYDFRRRDIAAGGQGAPLIPLYHKAIADKFLDEEVIAVINIGGVANITYIDKAENEIIAFDTGPGNAYIDDLMLVEYGKNFDDNGGIARYGEVDHKTLSLLLEDEYFQRKPCKSLDRNQFVITRELEKLLPQDKIATLTAFTVESIILAEKLLPKKPTLYLVTGGGRKNGYIMELLSNRLNILNIDKIAIDGDMVEAQGFGFLAVRSLKKMYLTLPSTTGVSYPVPGGVFCQA